MILLSSGAEIPIISANCLCVHPLASNSSQISSPGWKAKIGLNILHSIRNKRLIPYREGNHYLNFSQ
nr:MAG TPA: hypothetical protein [Bacteriophage sp.]DAW75879.1 MAG TPA: hypothetical protein [Crassvirales sp.]